MKIKKRVIVAYGGKRSRLWLKILVAVLAIAILSFAVLETIILTGGHTQIEGEPEVMIILGCQVKSWGPSEQLRDRLDTALDYLEGRDDILIVVSGGQGKDEPTTEAQAMCDYLVAHGIDGSRILQEGNSHNTHQNLVYSFELLKQWGVDTAQPYILVSNSFHLARAKLLADRMDGGADTYTLAAPTTHLPSRIHMYFREPFALVKSFLFDQ